MTDVGGQAGAAAGMQAAAAHAGEAWGNAARAHLEKYVEEVGGTFVSPWVRKWAAARGLVEPPHKRAWGAVFSRAQRDGVIRQSGFTVYGDDEMHSQSVRTWEPTSFRQCPP